MIILTLWCRNTIAIQEKELDANKKAIEKIKRFGDEMVRDRDLARTDLLRMQRLNAEQAEAALTQQEKMGHLEVEIKRHLEAAQKQRAQLGSVTKERDKNAVDVQLSAARLEQCHGERFEVCIWGGEYVMCEPNCR